MRVRFCSLIYCRQPQSVAFFKLSLSLCICRPFISNSTVRRRAAHVLHIILRHTDLSSSETTDGKRVFFALARLSCGAKMWGKQDNEINIDHLIVSICASPPGIPYPTRTRHNPLSKSITFPARNNHITTTAPKGGTLLACERIQIGTEFVKNKQLLQSHKRSI
jgi:hypothetical protein